MKINWNKIFSFSASESKYFKENTDKIEYTGCKFSGKACLNYLPEINDRFRESDQLYRERDFNRAIDALEKGWHKAAEIKAPDCQICVRFFQATVVQSLESIHSELQRMNRGIFATKRYQSCYIKADDLLRRIKIEKEEKPEYSLPKIHSVLQPVF